MYIIPIKFRIILKENPSKNAPIKFRLSSDDKNPTKFRLSSDDKNPQTSQK